MKTIVLEDDTAHDLAIAIGVHIPLVNRPDLLKLMHKLDGPSEYVAVHRKNDLPLIMELLDSEKEMAEEQLREYETNIPEFIADGQVRLVVATEVYDRLKEQL